MYLVNHLYFVCAKLHPNRTNFRAKGLARKTVPPSKTTQSSLDARPTRLPITNSRVKRTYEVLSLHVFSQSPLLCVCQTSSKSNNFQGKRASEKNSAPVKNHSKFTRCSTYSTSNHKFSSQKNVRKSKFVCS